MLWSLKCILLSYYEVLKLVLPVCARMAVLLMNNEFQHRHRVI